MANGCRNPHHGGVPDPTASWRARDILRGNVVWLSLVSLLNDTASEMIYPLLPFFLTTTLGAGPALLGLVEGAAESAASLLKLLSGWASDRFRRRPLVTTGYAIAAGVRPLIAAATAPWQVLVLRVTDRVGKGIRSAPRDALLSESVPAEHSGLAFGVHRAADHLGAAVGPLLASALLLAFSGEIRPVFAIAAVPGIVAALVIPWKVRESSVVTPSGSARPSLPQHPLDPSLRRFLVVIVLFTLGNATDAFLLLRAAELGVPLAAVPLLWSVHHVSKTLLSVPGGMLADRLGPRRSIAAGWLLYAGIYIAFAFADQAWQAWALFIVYGGFYGLTESPERVLVSTLAHAHRRGTAFGAYHAAVGIAALPASVLFGLLWARFSPSAAFLTGAALALAAAALLPLTLPRPATRLA